MKWDQKQTNPKNLASYNIGITEKCSFIHLLPQSLNIYHKIGPKILRYGIVLNVKPEILPYGKFLHVSKQSSNDSGLIYSLIKEGCSMVGLSSMFIFHDGNKTLFPARTERKGTSLLCIIPRHSLASFNSLCFT